MRITKTKFAILAILIILGPLVTTVSLPQVQETRFVLSASYTYPSNDGSGFSGISTYADGVVFTHYAYDGSGSFIFLNKTRTLDSTITNVTLGCAIWVNGTYFGFSDIDEVKANTRLLVNVTIINGTNVFSHENMTFNTWINGSYYGQPYQFWLGYWLELDICPLTMGEIYSIAIDMQVFYPEAI